MRKMSDKEMQQALEKGKWAAICTVTPECSPYAIEATYFIDGKGIGFMINPRGTTARNVRNNPRVLVKITFTNGAFSKWAGLSCFGQGSFVHDSDAIRRGWQMLEQVVQTDYSNMAEKFCAAPEKSPYFRVTINKRTGRCSANPGELFEFKGFGRSQKVLPGDEKNV